MLYKRMVQGFVLLALLASCLGFVGPARAWGCNTYVTVQWGDTLSGIAALCGTTVYAIQVANPGLGTWVYAGQYSTFPVEVQPFIIRLQAAGRMLSNSGIRLPASRLAMA